MDEVSAFVTSSDTILKSITDPDIGLMGAMNCSFLKVPLYYTYYRLVSREWLMDYA